MTRLFGRIQPVHPLRHAGRLEEGAKALLLMKERYPENSYAALELGDIFFERDDYTMAIASTARRCGQMVTTRFRFTGCGPWKKPAGRGGGGLLPALREIIPHYRQATRLFILLLRQNRKEEPAGC